jgi:hypothetical protein
MIEPSHLLTEVIRPVLRHLRAHSENSELLILGTACTESDCGRWLRQIGGPALGIHQMEPATHDDIWDRFLIHRPSLMERVKYFSICYGNGKGAEEMAGNLYYATAMCRIHYLRVPAPIPDNLPAQAAYWKQYYNTPAGSGSVDKYISKWNQFVGHASLAA